MPTTSSPSLSDLQEWMKWVLTHPHGVNCALSHSHPLKECINVIGETPAVNRATRLSIYGNGYYSRIVEVLSANFSSVKNVLGMNAFDALARRYLNKYPSTFKCIDDIGHRMAEFLRKDPASKKFPFLPQLAELEWTAHQAFFADDWPFLDPQKFKKVSEPSWPNARFTLDSAARLLKLSWPVDQIWREDGNLSPARLKRVKKEPICVLIFRNRDKQMRIARIDAIQFDLLTGLSGQKPLGQVLLSLVKKHSPNDGLPVQEWFQTWMQQGIFKSITGVEIHGK